MIDRKDLRIVGVVYKITNTVNSKIYIGATKTGIRRRWNSHVHYANRGGKNSRLYDEMRLFGISNFKIEVLKTCYSIQQLHFSEQYFIETLKTRDCQFGFNNSIGGECPSKGVKRSEDVRNKISIIASARIRKPHSEETKRKIGNANSCRDMSKAIEASAAVRRGKTSHNAKQVLQTTLDGEFIKKHNSYSDAASSVGGNVQAFLLLKTGRLKTYKKFKWKFEN